MSMYNRAFLTLITAFALILLSIPAVKAEPFQLNQERIDKFAQSMPLIKDWLKKHHALKAIDPNSIQVPDSPSAAIHTEASAIIDQLQSFSQDPELALQISYIVQTSGFESREEWLKTGQRIGNAWLSIANVYDSKKAKKNLSEQQEIVENDTNIPPQMRSHMLNLIDAAQNQAKEIDSITRKEERLVKKNLKLLRIIFE